MSAPGIRSSKGAWLGLFLLVGVVIALRWPTFGFEVWNVDEAIHAAVARTLQNGGILYRDAIDQRTPLSYYAVAALFTATGANNIWAMHALATALIVGTMVGLFLIGRKWRTPATGLGAALVYGIFSTSLFYPGDAYALNTEWFVAGFTTWAAWAFWRGAWTLSGLLFGLAFLSKQPALLDLGAPLLVLVYHAWEDRLAWRQSLRRGAKLLAGFTLPVALATGYFALHGALADFYFYAWQYNLRYYAPEIAPLDRALSALKPFQLIWTHYPMMLVAFLLTTTFALLRSVQLRPTAEEKRANGLWLYVLIWSLTGLAGATASGRGFDHYYIQFLPACCLSLALGWSGLTAWAWTAPTSRWRQAGVVVLTGLILLQYTQGVRHFHATARLPEDPSRRAGEFIKAHTTPDERLFVWGYHPDLYLFADRRPASRFIYGSFLTGLIPWTNVAADRDTAYAIVPGARATLLHELETVRPTFIVDCSVGPNRFWSKYPLSTFPELQQFITEHYVLAEPVQFGGQGFGLYLIKDSYRRQPLALSGGNTVADLPPPRLTGPFETGDDTVVQVTLSGQNHDQRLQRLELLHNGVVLAGASFLPAEHMQLSLSIPLAQLGAGPHRLAARAVAATGQSATSEEQLFAPNDGWLPPERFKEFSLPLITSHLMPTQVRAPFGAVMDGPRLQIHAPARLTYLLPDRANRLRGHFGVNPGAYAPANLSPTDGAEFLVTLIGPEGRRQTLFNRWLQPARVPSDEGPQPLNVQLPPNARGTLELVITNGPAGNAVSDWTYWSDLVLETSR